jgi:hypothetical protein
VLADRGSLYRLQCSTKDAIASVRQLEVGPPARVGRKYRECDLDHSYAESFRQLCARAYRLQSCLYRRLRNPTKLLMRDGSDSAVNDLCFPDTDLEPADERGDAVGTLQTKRNQPPE